MKGKNKKTNIKAIADVFYKDTFVCENSVQGKRATMEDAYASYKSERWCLYAVMDGHAGNRMAKLVKVDLYNLVGLLNEATAKIKNEDEGMSAIVTTTIINYFVNLDLSVYYDKKKYRSVDGSGTTCTGFAYDSSSLSGTKKTYLYPFNIGDSRTAVVTMFEGSTQEPSVFFETRDHNVDDKEEYRRISTKAEKNNVDVNDVVTVKARGIKDPARMLKGTVARFRGLMMSRSLGDYSIKGYPSKKNSKPTDPTYGMLVSTPDVYRVDLQSIDSNDVYVVLACDGIFDVVSAETLALLIKEANASGDRKKACSDIVYMADLKGSGDNMTVAIVRFVKETKTD